MIKQGIITFPFRLFGYVGAATQEEAERLSDGLHTAGLVVFVPLTEGATEADIDLHIVRREDVET